MDFLIKWFSLHSLSKWGESQVHSKPQSNLPSPLHQVGAALCSAPASAHYNKLSTSKTAQLPIFWSQIMPGEPKPWFHLLKVLWVCPQVQFPVLRAAQLCMLQSLHSGSLLGAGASCGCSFILVPWERVWVFFHMCMKRSRRTGFPSLLCCVWVEGSKSVWGKKDSSAEGCFGVTALNITHSISLLNLLLCVLYSTTVVF